MKYNALIFDRDGVLTYFDLVAAADFFQPLLPISVWEMAKEWQAFGEKWGFPDSLSAEQRFFAAFWAELAERHRLTTNQSGALHTLDYTRFVRAFPDAHPALQSGRTAGYRIGVLSNFSLASLAPSLAAAGLADLVDAACAATVIGAAKPQRAAYAIAAKALGVEPQTCLFFDDELACVEGARSAGMWGFLVDRHSTAAPGPDAVTTLHCLPALLGFADDRVE